MFRKIVLPLATVILSFAAGTFTGAWVERKTWRDAREVVEKHRPNVVLSGT
jgi:hypothetical protein